MQLEGDALMTVIGIGQDLFDGANNAGNVQFLDGNLILSTEETYTVNTWNSIDIEYDCVADIYSYRWNGGPLTGPYSFYQPSAYLSHAFILGGAPDCPGDFLYDDFSLTVNEMPGAPTNCWAEEPSGGVETWDNFTVDQDNPVEGTVSGSYLNIDEKPPAVPDGITEDIQEVLVGGGSTVTDRANNDYIDAAVNEGEVAAGTLADLNDGDNNNYYQLRETETGGNPANRFSQLAWIFEVLVTGGSDVEFFVQAYHDVDADGDDFTFQYSNAVGGPWTDMVTVTDTTDTGTYLSYSDATLDGYSGLLYIRVRDTDWGNGNNAYFGSIFIDDMYLDSTTVAPPAYTLEHRWRTEDITGGAAQLDLYVRGRHNTGSDDTFTIGVSNVLGGPYTPTAITINSDTLTTYSDSIVGFSGVIYINVIDDNTGDGAQQDTVLIDTIWITYFSMGGSVTTTQVAIADNPVDGTVLGTFALTTPPPDAPPDGNSEQITEVAAAAASEPTPLKPGPGPEPKALLFGPYDMTGPAMPAGWSEYDAGGSSSANPWFPVTATTPPTMGDADVMWINWDTPYNNRALETEAYDFSGYQNVYMNFEHFMQFTWMDVLYLEYSTDGGGAGGTWNPISSWINDGTWTDWTWRTNIDCSAVDLTNNVRFRFRYEGTDANSNGVDYVEIHGDVAGNTLEHIWTIEDMPADSITRTLYVTARYNTGSDDDFAFSWSQNVGGPWTPLAGVVVNSDTYTTYVDNTISVAFVGPLYLQVVDTNGGDATLDTLYVDCIYVESEVSAVSTDIIIHWDLSADDGAGENDVTQYNIYRADEEDGDTIAGPYTYVGSSPAGTITYNDVGEGADLVNQAWYYVDAQDIAQTNASGYFSKLNFAPVISNVQADGSSPVLIISPGTPSVTLTATATDDSNHYEAIPQMDYAEYFVDPPGDPGQGSGLQINPADLVWDTMAEALSGTVDSSLWVPGTYNIWVRAREMDGVSIVYGAPLNVTVEVVDGPPLADAGPDQTVAQHTLVTFDGSFSTDDVGIANYWWNFTDGGPQTLTGISPTYTFDNEGIYNVTLTVADTIGQTDSDWMVVNVTDGDPPVADAGPDQTSVPGFIVTFDGSASYDPGHLGEPIIDGIVNWTWTFDDGTGPQTIFGPNPTHQFNLPGDYEVTLTVTDAAPVITGGPYTDTDTMWVNVSEIFDIDITEAALSGDWILISFPNQVEGDPLAIVVDAIDAGAGLVVIDIVQWFDPTNAPGTEWETSATFKPPMLNTFNYVNNSMGFWAHIAQYGDGVLTITGPLANTGDDGYLYFKAGWNLVGYPFPVGQPSADTFATSFEIDDMYCYDSTQPYRLRFYDWWGLELHEPGKGYWVHVNADEVLWMGAP
jgi:PKD repeat protein